MRYSQHAAMAISVLTLGMVSGIAVNGLSSARVTLLLRACGTVLFTVVQAMRLATGNQFKKLVIKRARNRNESEGTFSQQMEKFAANVEHVNIVDVDKPSPPDSE